MSNTQGTFETLAELGLQVRALLALAALFVCASLFLPLFPFLRENTGAIFNLAVILAGVLLGARLGLVFALSALSLNAWLYHLAGWSLGEFAQRLWAGHLSLIFIGYVVGRLVDTKLSMSETSKLKNQKLVEINDSLHGKLIELQRFEVKAMKVQRCLHRAQKVACIGGWDWHLPTAEVFWSDEVYELLGLDPATDKACFATYMQGVHEDDQTYVRRSLRKALKHKRDFSIEHRIRHSSLGIRKIITIGNMLPDEKGHVIEMAGVVQDITDLARVNEETRHYQSHLGDLVDAKTDEVVRTKQFCFGLLEHISDKVAILERGNILLANPALKNLLGKSQKELAGHTLDDFIWPEAIIEAKPYLDRLVGQAGEARFKSSLKSQEGAKIKVSIQAFLSLYDNRDVMVVIFRDEAESAT